MATDIVDNEIRGERFPFVETEVDPCEPGRMPFADADA